MVNEDIAKAFSDGKRGERLELRLFALERAIQSAEENPEKLKEMRKEFDRVYNEVFDLGAKYLDGWMMRRVSEFYERTILTYNQFTQNQSDNP